MNDTEEVECSETFSHCGSALKWLQKTKNFPDVILLDIGLPGMSGLDGIAHFQKLSPTSKIIMLTGSDRPNDILRAISLGAFTYVVKPVSLEELVKTISEAHKGGAILDSKLAKIVLDMLRVLSPVTRDYNLTQKENDIVKLMVEGLTTREIARSLNISENRFLYTPQL